MGIASIHQIADERGTTLRKVHDGELLTIKTGFEVLDQRTQGSRGGDFIVIGARPAMGKSTFALNLAQNIATQNGTDAKVLLFSSETSDATISDRMISDISGIDA